MLNTENFSEIRRNSSCKDKGSALYLAMLFFNLKTTLNIIAAMMLMAQCLGLVFCGDSNCLRGDSEEDCESLICSLLSNHSTPAPASASGTDHSCQCFCHLLIDPPNIAMFVSPFDNGPHFTGEAVQFLAEPVRNIDHPPLA